MGASIQDVRTALVGPYPGSSHSIENTHKQRGPIHHGSVYDLALPGLFDFQERTQDTQGKQHTAATQVADEVQGRHGLLTGPSDGIKRARQGDIVNIVPGRPGKGTLLTPSRHTSKDEFGVPLQAHIRAEPQPFHHARPEAFDKRIRLLNEFENRLTAFGFSEID